MRRYGMILLALITLGAGGIWFFTQTGNPTTGVLQLRLTSDPFPLAVGSSNLLVSLTTGDGTPLSDAQIFVTGTFNHPGMIPLSGRGQPQQADGMYPVRMRWSMAGDWVIDITALLPDETVIKEQYTVYVYPVVPNHLSPLRSYISVRELDAMTHANPEREKWLVIPMGTQAVLRQGHGEDSEDILLKLGGQDTLVIRNNDIADHTIGPFFVRSGETVRQRFTQAAVFVGECSVSDNGSISIIVEG